MKYSVVNGSTVTHGDLDYNYHPAGAVINEDESLTHEQLLALGAKQAEARAAGYTVEQIAAVKVTDIITSPSV